MTDPTSSGYLRPIRERKLHAATRRIKSLEQRVNKTDDILSVIIIESDNQHSKPERLSNVLTAVSDLYKVVAEFEGINPNTLSVITCDSGSDKFFDFLGAAKAMAGLKDLLLGLYDRIVFHKNHSASLDVELIGRSLSEFEKVQQLENSGALDGAKAELIRRKLLSGCTKFVQSGAIIPEFQEAVALCEPRKLLGPEPKLIAAPINGDPDNSEPKPQTRKKRTRKKKPKPSGGSTDGPLRDINLDE